MAGEKIMIARQDTLEAVHQDTQAIRADTAALNIPEILTQNIANGPYQIYGQDTTRGTLDRNMTLLDIQGRGKLFWFLFYGHFSAQNSTPPLKDTNTYSDVKITIDGEVFLYLRLHDADATQSASMTFYILDLQNLLNSSTSSTSIYYFPGLRSTMSWSANMKTVQPSQEMQQIDIIDRANCPIRNFIPFEKSLKVEALLHSDVTMKSDYPKYKYDIGCILDE